MCCMKIINHIKKFSQTKKEKFEKKAFESKKKPESLKNKREKF